jgi:hypothetical protein
MSVTRFSFDALVLKHVARELKPIYTAITSVKRRAAICDGDQLGLGFVMGVVDPQAKRRFWD